MLVLALTIVFVVVVILAVVAAILARAPDRRSAGDLRLHALSHRGDVLCYRGFFSNSAVLVLAEGVVVVDTQVSPIAGQRLRAEIERVTDKPIAIVVNTHYHGDHTGGNALFPEAQVVATDDTARYVVERDEERVEYAHTFGLEFQEVHPTIGPTSTFSGKKVLRIGDDEVHVLQLGRVETPDACIVHWPRQGVVACGDGVATHDYPYLGVPFMDEGLRDDGSWIGYLQAIRALEPVVLIPGHGPPLVGKEVIAARLDLLIGLLGDLLAATKEELAKGTPIPTLVERVDAKLAHYRVRPDLQEHTVSQRFAIYRCINNLSPERKGKGWWHDLRPSVIRRAPEQDVSRALARIQGSPVKWALARAGDERALSIAALEAWVEQHEGDAAAHGALADLFFDGMIECRKAGHPFVDAMEYVAASSRSAKAALALDPHEKLALLNLGVSEVFGGMVLAQCMDVGIQRIERALAQPGLDARQRRKGSFFLGKAHQVELRDDEADRWFRAVLPGVVRPLFPLARARMRAYP